jgi:nucleotide-binding universal stress UspA family protein
VVLPGIKNAKGSTMLDPILVPLDGSQLAECVLPQVVSFGQAFNAKISLLHVLDTNQAGSSAQLMDLLNWQINKTKAKLNLKRIGDQLEKSGLQTKGVVLEGPVVESIIEFAQSQKMKLVILSSHGRSGLRNWEISSVTQKIIQSAPTSVLLVRAPQLNEQRYERILVPLDGSWRAENVLPIITVLARFHKSQIQIVHVVKMPEMARHMPPVQEDTDLSDQIVARNREEALQYLEQVQSRSTMAGIDVKTHLIIDHDPMAALHELVEREQINMLALSAHGFSGNIKWPYGSMVNNFILYGKIPLLIVQDLPEKGGSNPAYLDVRERSEH